MAITIFNQNLTTLQQTVTHNFTHIQAGQLYMVGYKGKIVEYVIATKVRGCSQNCFFFQFWAIVFLAAGKI